MASCSPALALSPPARLTVPARTATHAAHTSPSHSHGTVLRRSSSSSRSNRSITRTRGGSSASRVTCFFSRRSAPPTKPTVTLRPDYRIPIVLLGTAVALVSAEQLVPAVPVGLLGLLLVVQATRLRFVFDNEALQLVTLGEESTENAFVGGENRWNYSSFTNWEFWWPSFPVLVYFKETQTKPEGQIHFFPIIVDGQQLYDVMVERCGPSINSVPEE